MVHTLRDDDLTVLTPLAALIAQIVRDTPIRMGPGGTDDLTAQLTVRTCVWIGKNVLPRTRSLAAFVNDVDAERQAQLTKWGDQRRPDGTSGHNFRREADAARRSCQAAASRDAVTWFHILREEFWEAMSETDPERLRAELVQVASVCAAWIHDLDTRAPVS